MEESLTGIEDCDVILCYYLSFEEVSVMACLDRRWFWLVNDRVWRAKVVRDYGASLTHYVNSYAYRNVYKELLEREGIGLIKHVLAKNWIPLIDVLIARSKLPQEELDRMLLETQSMDALHTLIRHGAKDPTGKVLKKLFKSSTRFNVYDVSVLLDAGSPVNCDPERVYDEPLVHAVIKGDLSIVRYLINRGADLRMCGDYALMLATTTDNILLTKLLLDHGANADAQPTEYHNSPLENAVLTGNIELAKLLIDRGATITRNAYAASARVGILNIMELLYGLIKDKDTAELTAFGDTAAEHTINAHAIQFLFQHHTISPGRISLILANSVVARSAINVEIILANYSQASLFPIDYTLDIAIKQTTFLKSIGERNNDDTTIIKMLLNRTTNSALHTRAIEALE